MRKVKSGHHTVGRERFHSREGRRPRFIDDYEGVHRRRACTLERGECAQHVDVAAIGGHHDVDAGDDCTARRLDADDVLQVALDAGDGVGEHSALPHDAADLGVSRVARAAHRAAARDGLMTDVCATCRITSRGGDV